MGNLYLLLLIGLLAGFTQTGSALECFSCNSATDKTCGDDNFSNNNKQDCSKIMPPEGLSKVVNSLLGTNVAKGCAKVIVSNTGTEKIITRSCFWGDVDNPKKTCAEATSNNLECHVCTGDLCNGAESITYGIAVFLIAFIGRLLI